MSDKPILRRGPRAPASPTEAAPEAPDAARAGSAPPPRAPARRREVSEAGADGGVTGSEALPSGYQSETKGLFGWSAEVRGASPSPGRRPDDGAHAAPRQGPPRPGDRGAPRPPDRGPSRSGPVGRDASPRRDADASARPPRPDTRWRDRPDPEAPDASARGAGDRPGRPDRSSRGDRREVDISEPDVSVVVAAGEVPISNRLTELEALASGDMDMAALLSATPMRTRLPQPGARIKGIITAVHHDELHVDLGLRTSGVLLRRERPNAAIGDEVEAYVVEADDNGIQLSARLSGQAAAAHLDDAKDAGIPVEGLIASRNGGGYEVKLGGVRAFCPTSHISRIPLLDPDSVIGTTVPFLILETGEKIVVSHRALAEREMEGAREAFWASAREGDKRLGVVTSVSAWAAWVDLDGVEAKLPRKEFGWEEIEDLSTRLVRGQRLDVRLHELDAAQGRITVSTRDPSLDPWLSIDEKLRVGEVRTGRVMGQADYGAFVEVLPGLQGLMHVSRLGGEPLPTPGAAVEVRVLSFDARSRRIELAPPAFEPSSAAAPGAQKAGAASQQGVEVEATVVEVEPRGVRVRLADGRQGWLPANEIQLAPNQTLNHRFRAGYTLKARIKSEGPGDRVTLSQRDDDGSEGAWRGQLASAPRASMGTLGDLLRGARR